MRSMGLPSGIALSLAACNPVVPTAASSDGGGGTTTPTGGAATTGTPATSDTTSTTSTTSTTTETSTGDEPPEGCFVAPTPDVGVWACDQPELVAQPPGCGDGVRAPHEFCHQSVALRCDTGGAYGGAVVADFGNGPAMVWTAGNAYEVHMVAATVDGLLQSPCVVMSDIIANGIVVDDFDADANVDLVLSELDGPDLIAAYRNTHPVRFERVADTPADGALHLGTLELDGVPPRDLFSSDWTSYDPGVLEFYFGRDDGTYEHWQSLALDLGVRFLNARDIDGDGIDELAAYSTVDYAAGISALRVFDVDPDGLDETLVIEQGDGLALGPPAFVRRDPSSPFALAYTLGSDQLAVRAGLGDGTFAGVPVVVVVDGIGYILDAIDLDGDGDDELVTSRGIVDFADDGTPSLRASFERGGANYGFVQVVAYELNDDGLLDLVLTTSGGQADAEVLLVLSNP